MKRHERFLSMGFRLRHVAIIASVLAALTFSPKSSFAQLGMGACEVPGVAAAASANLVTGQAATVTAMTLALNAAYTAEAMTAEIALKVALETMKTAFFGVLDIFWSEWREALQDMTKQLHANILEKQKQESQGKDAENIADAARAIEEKKEEANEGSSPTDEGGPSDTTALTQNVETASLRDALIVGYAKDFNMLGNNNKNTPAGAGKAPLQKSRWEIYRDKFCDKDANNGAAGCTDPLPTANMHVLPSKTIFGKLTQDLNSEDYRDALKELMFNITGYAPNNPIQKSALGSATGLQTRHQNREYMAQMDAVGSLVYATAAERAPGDIDTSVQKRRKALGFLNASPTPSHRETRQMVVDTVRSPRYYISLLMPWTNVSKRELYLKAYNLVMLYDMIERQEKISTVYAIEAANLLEKSDRSRHSASPATPLRSTPTGSGGAGGSVGGSGGGSRSGSGGAGGAVGTAP